MREVIWTCDKCGNSKHAPNAAADDWTPVNFWQVDAMGLGSQMSEAVVSKSMHVCSACIHGLFAPKARVQPGTTTTGQQAVA